MNAASAERVSVVIPTKDRLPLLPRTLETVFAQERVALDVIVVDDGSTDGTADAVRALDGRVRVVRHETSRGVGAARNSGIAAASGSWVGFLDDDDLWAPQKLRAQLTAADRAGAGFVYGGALTVREPDGAVVSTWDPLEPDELVRTIRRYNPVPAGASNVLVRTALVREAGGFDPALSHLADWDLWLRLLERTPAAACLEPLVAYVAHESNMHVVSIESALAEGRYLARKHADSTLPGSWDRVVFERWLAEGYADAGRPLAAAHRFAVAAVHGRRAADVGSALALVLRAAGLRRPRERPVSPAPDWVRTALGAA